MAKGRDPAFAEVSREECLRAAKAFAEDRRKEIQRRHRDGESGGNVVASMSAIADSLLLGVFDFALFHVANPKSLLRRASLCALGGYGRKQLNPHSDLDIGLVYDGRLDSKIESLNNFLVPFLWDIGYENSYTVRSIREATKLAREDTKVFLSYLESRLLWGSKAPYAKLMLAIREQRPGESARGFAQLQLRNRRETFHTEAPAIYSPEPNVKDGAGGLRDYHTALWMMTVVHGVTSLDDAVGRGFLSSDEQLEIVEALDLVWRIRNELHFHAGKCEDRLTWANQRVAATAFGYMDGPNPDTSRLMEDYYGAARRLRRLLQVAARVCDPSSQADPRESASSDTDFYESGGMLHIAGVDPHWFAESPARLMSAFWESARRGVPLAPDAERFIEQNVDLVGDTFRSSDLVRRFFTALCNRPKHAGRTLRQAATTGLLSRYIPEFSAIEDIIRYEDFHHYPVDEHTLRAIEALGRIDDIEGTIGRCLQTALEHLSDPYILVVALLLHDLGKAEGEEHVVEGTRLAQVICERIGFPPEDAERVAFLVQHHLVMTNTSLYRDTDDSDVVGAFAKTMKSEERLRALFLLSYADLSAVGPNVWNDWKGALLVKLYLRAEKALLGHVESLDEEYWTLPKAQAVRDAVGPGLAGHVERHLKAFGDRYFLAFSPEMIAVHMECVAEAEESGLAVRCVTNEESEVTEAIICTADRGGLVAEIAGCFASELLDVKNAALFTRSDGIALDCFTIADARRERPLTPAQAEVIARVFRNVLISRQNVDDVIAQSRSRLFALFQPAVPVKTSVSFDNGASRTHTVLDIECGDHTGLLYAITRSLTNQGLDIASARVVTDARRVRDSFYISLNGGKIEDSGLQADIREALEQAIHPGPAVESKGGTV